MVHVVKPTVVQLHVCMYTARTSHSKHRSVDRYVHIQGLACVHAMGRTAAPLVLGASGQSCPLAGCGGYALLSERLPGGELDSGLWLAIAAALQ